MSRDVQPIAARSHPARPWWALGCAVALVTVTASLLFVAVPAGQAGGAAPPLPRIGPVTDVDNNDVADPFILTVADGGHPTPTTYFLFGTTDWRSNVPAARSSDRLHWQDGPDALPVLPRWAAPSISMTWAPATLAAGGRYLMYVTTEEATSGRQCIALATSASPEGPYADSGSRPFVCQRALGGSIDPSVRRDAAGHLHLLWKSDGNCCGIPAAIWEQALSADGRHLLGRAHRLLSADQPWQRGNIEAPAVMAAGHGWWLFYSGGDWRRPDYATGIAFCPTLQGPCHEVLDHPFLASTSSLRTPSGLETFRDGQGRTWVAFTSTVAIPSRRHPHHYYLNRVLDVAPILTG